MDWGSLSAWSNFLSIINPTWLIIAILISLFAAFVLVILFDIMGIEISGVFLFLIVLAVLIFLKLMNIADFPGQVEKAAGTVIAWIL